VLHIDAYLPAGIHICECVRVFIVRCTRLCLADIIRAGLVMIWLQGKIENEASYHSTRGGPDCNRLEKLLLVSPVPVSTIISLGR
jgi:hypothetical protein